MKMTKSQPQSHQKLHGTQEFWGMKIGDEEKSLLPITKNQTPNLQKLKLPRGFVEAIAYYFLPLQQSCLKLGILQVGKPKN